MYKVTLEQDEDGVFIAEVPELPGCISDGHTREEAIKNIKDAIAGYLTVLKKHNMAIPSPLGKEIVEVTCLGCQ